MGRLFDDEADLIIYQIDKSDPRRRFIDLGTNFKADVSEGEPPVLDGLAMGSPGSLFHQLRDTTCCN